MNRLKGMVPYLLLCVVVFYFLPLVSRDTVFLLISLVLMTPIACFMVSMSYGVVISFDFLFCVLIGLLFVPAMFIYYNTALWVYIPIYLLVAVFANIMGQLVGSTFKKVEKRAIQKV